MKHWIAAIGLCLTLYVPGLALADNTSTVGGEATSVDTTGACRGSKFYAERDGVLLSADIKASGSDGEALEWHVYESSVETSGYARLLQSSTERTGTVASNEWDWESSGPLAANLQAGRYYVVLGCWPNSTVGYRYASAQPEALPVGTWLGGVDSFPGGPDANASFGTSGSGYSFRLHTSAGRVLDVDAEFGREGPFVEAFAGGAVYRPDSPRVLLGFRQQVHLASDQELDWYVVRCQGATQADCPDGSSVWEPVATGVLSAEADPFNPDPWIDVPDLQVALEPGWLYIAGLGWDSATDVGYHRIIDSDLHPDWGETLGFVSTSDALPLFAGASFDWDSSFEMPQQLITAEDSADGEETSSFAGVSAFWKMGNIVEVDTLTRLEQLSFNLYTAYTGIVRMAVYSGSSEQGAYNLHWQREIEVEAASALEWVDSGPIEIDIGPDPGSGTPMYYLFAVGFDGAGVHARESSPSDTPLSFGTRVHGWYSYTGSSGFDASVGTDFVDRVYAWRAETCSGCVDLDLDGFDARDECDDSNPAVAPGAPEVCDGVDNDCDGLIDDGHDADNDGFTPCGGDCDDSDPSTFPNAPEDCDNRDQDCDGVVDEDFDGDGDGFVDALGLDCSTSHSPTALDCDDADPTVFPFAPELCDGLDNDCDLDVDESVDVDGDGFAACDGDCDDGDAGIGPAMAEICDGVDTDCSGAVGSGSSGEPDEQDLDGDGWLSCALDLAAVPPAGILGGGDCADSDGDRYPGAEEVCDGVDNDCDGVDDGDYDLDGDGFASADLCPSLGTDCDDADPASYPGAPELCDGLDNDCDGVVPTGAFDEVDDDGDGATECDGDCDDADPTVSPDYIEACDGVDNDCDGGVDEDFDLDLDGAFARYLCAGGTDCDDGNAAVHPAASELCDAVDNDCDGLVDEIFDHDGDGYVTGSVGACEAAWGPAVDCDDFDDTIWPGAPELCNAIDDDCDGELDEDFDEDGDGWVGDGPGCAAVWPDLDCDDTNIGVFPFNVENCANTVDDNCDGAINENVDLDSDGVTTCNGDCDDSDASVLPGAPELCDGRDNDCDLVTDEFFDADGDGFLDAAFCSALPGPTDCDDADPEIHPGVAELCDAVDQDCDGEVDEAFDVDLDGVVDGAVPECVEAWGDDVDCDDTDEDVFPGADELCNATDDDCDGAVDEGFDGDGDGVFANLPDCVDAWGESLDCDDADPSVHPAFGSSYPALELCDGADNDCDGVVLEDADEDGYFDLDNAACAATRPLEELDCDDASAEVHPDAVEVCDDGVDNECDGLVDAEDVGCELIDLPGDDDDATDAPPASVPVPSIAGACGDCSSDISGGGFGLLSLLVLVRRRRR